jgi:hypothetical protein
LNKRLGGAQAVLDAVVERKIPSPLVIQKKKKEK